MSFLFLFLSFGCLSSYPNPFQLERLQFENTSEWGKRERLEAEKQNLEEENRRMKLQVKEIQGLLEMKNKATLTKVNYDQQNAQSKLLVKNKGCAFLSLITRGAFCKRINIS